jgi:GNAT superfamily N-acetyltransferase
MGTEPYRIGAAVSEADIDTVAALFQAYAGSLGVDLGYQDFGAELAALPGKYAAPNGALLLARAPEGAALGCVALRPLEADGCCEMKRLYVAPAGRGTGLGRALAETAVAEARRIGYREVRLDTLPFMQTAMALYDAMGFVPIPPYYETPVAGTRFLALSLAT